MTSVGRGRGRIWAVAQNKESALRRPGKPDPQNDYSSLLSKINEIEGDDDCKALVQEIIQLVNNMMQKESLMEIISNLYQYAVSSKEIRQKIVLLFYNTAFQRICDTDQRYVLPLLFFIMQGDYEKRNELRQENIEHFRGVVAFLCGMYNYPKRLHSCTILELPIIDYMEMLLETATVDDVEIIVEQLVSVGKYLRTRHQAEVDQLMNVIRETLITRNLCQTTRGLLLYVVDLASHDFDKMPSNLQKFYAAQLDHTSFMQRRHSAKDQNTVSAPIQSTENEKIERNTTSEQGDCPANKNNPVPRAIRGSGAKNHKNDHKIPHNTNSSLPKQ